MVVLLLALNAVVFCLIARFLLRIGGECGEAMADLTLQHRRCGKGRR